MGSPPKKMDLWRLPALGLWLAFFLVGLAPEYIYTNLRAAGGVVTQRALVNSPYMITVALAVYLAVFAWGACRRAGLTPFQSQDRALQLAIVALIAFLPIDLRAVINVHDNPLIRARFAIYLAAATKVIAWWYLLTLFLRYYLMAAEDVFARIPSLFPSAHGGGRHPEDASMSAMPNEEDGAPHDESQETSETRPDGQDDRPDGGTGCL